MPPGHNVIIGHVGGAQPMRRSLRKASTDVIIGHASHQARSALALKGKIEI